MAMKRNLTAAEAAGQAVFDVCPTISAGARRTLTGADHFLSL